MNIENMKKIFDENMDKRICVLGTTCTGKTTLISKLKVGEDMDELVRTKLHIRPGIPLFGTVLLESDLIIYLHIGDELLLKRTSLRNVDFQNAKRMQNKIEKEIAASKIQTITLEVE